MKRIVVVRVAITLEHLLFRVPGGVGRYTARLATLLPALFPDDGYTGFVARHPRTAIDAVLAEYSVSMATQRLPFPRPVLYDAWHTIGAPRLSVLAQPLAHADVVHAPSVAVPPRGHGGLVVTVHDVAPLLFPETFPARGRWFHRSGLRAAARRADAVIVVSHDAAADVVERTAIGADRIRVVHNGVDDVDVTEEQVQAMRRRLGLERPYVFWVGTQEPRKNVRLLVQAFAAATASEPSLPHDVVLAGAAGWLHEQASTMPGADRLGDRLRLLGRVGDDDLYALYRGADLFAFPSIHEGFGLPVLEAMRQGTPVLCTDRSSLPEVAGNAALLVPPDADAWTPAIISALTDDALRARLAATGRSRAAEFSWERCARQTHAVYAELL